MKSIVKALLVATGLTISVPACAEHWSADDLATLHNWTAAAPSEGLSLLPVTALENAIRKSSPEEIDAAADDLALKLARLHLFGSASEAERQGWNIVDTDRDADLAVMLDEAVRDDRVAAFFMGLRPAHPDYEMLRRAFLQETDEARRTALARNMERWRWMPRNPGNDFLIVNTPTFEATLWRDGRPAGKWRVIVGTQSTPTPVFSATISGVNINPWWNIPSSIVRESVGAIVRRNPSAASARGYVWSGGAYRQKPGPNNALGEMKLVMPNPYSVYLHDTPNKALFDEEVRAFSHGCVRVDHALDLAVTLLAGRMSRAEIDAVVETRTSTTVDLTEELPVYITYFTAIADQNGTVQCESDLYNRDSRIRVRAEDAPPTQRAALDVDGGCAAS